MATPQKANYVATAVLAVLLWLATAVLAAFDLYALRQIYVLLSIQFGATLKWAQDTATYLVCALGVVVTAFVFGTAEYHRLNFGSAKSWKLFGWSLAAEIGIAALYYMLGASEDRPILTDPRMTT